MATAASTNNMRVRIDKQASMFSATVVWARSGRFGMTIQDTSGHWEGMPEKIEAAVYDGLSESEQRQIESELPDVFPGPAEAIAWGMTQITDTEEPVFRDEAHAQNAYQLIRTVRQPGTAQEMRDAWVAEVRARQSGGTTITDEERAGA